MSLAETLQPAAQPAAPAELPGNRLREARQAQNLSAADVARQLKLSVWQVEALEADRYQQLPGPIFVRGFIRNYARLVKLDPEALLRAAGDSLPQAAPATDTPPPAGVPFPTAEPPRWPRYAGAAIVIFGALAVYEFAWNEPKPAPRSAPAAVVPAPKAQPAPAVALPAQPEAAPAVAPAIAPGGDAKAEAAAARNEATQARAGERRVRMVFREESWVEIRDRQERVIFSQLNPAGTVQEVSGLPPLSLVVGNSQGVQMTYEDSPVDLARHTKVDVARLTLE